MLTLFIILSICYIVSSSGIQNFCYGKWKLRYTNDYNLKGNHYLIIEDDKTIKFK
jgi:alpha-acetolactate decarboxylase